MDFMARRSKIKAQNFKVGSTMKNFDSNLYYLTGFSGRPAILIRENGNDRLEIQSQTEREILFDGVAYDLDHIKSISKISQVTACELGSQVVGSHGEVFEELAFLRRTKDAHEISRMKTAGKISRSGHDFIAKSLKSGATEWDLKIAFEHHLFQNGARELAYSTISGAGQNSTVLHATKYDRRLFAEDVFLLDGAAKFDHYCADITSTWSLKDSEEFQRIAEIVSRAQKLVIQNVRVGTTLNELHRLAKNSMAEDLLKLKIIHSREEIDQVFPHSTSHWIGLDVHDPKSERNGDIQLEAGMTFTVEPGLYFTDRHRKNYGRFQNLGVRFEEDIHVLKSGCELLSR